MKFIPLHTTNTAIVYKNSLCSMATLWVLIFITLSVMLPVLLVSLLSPYSGITESRVLYEQPRVDFTYQYLFVGTLESEAKKTIVCSSFDNFNARLDSLTNSCEATKYWTEDLDHDTNIDSAHFKLNLHELPGRLEQFQVILFFDAQLEHKCLLRPPAVLVYQYLIPKPARLNTGIIQVKGELQLKQSVEFICPFPGRDVITSFRNVQFDTNTTADISQYKLEAIRKQIKSNPAYFQLEIFETYSRQSSPQRETGLSIELEIDVVQVPARYHLSIWERLGQFWLYFASFFGISFYIMNKVKDFLFGRHIIRSWEIIPWKKLY